MKPWLNQYAYKSIIGLVCFIAISTFISSIVTVILSLIVLGLSGYYHREKTKQIDDMSQALSAKTNDVALLRETLSEAERDKAEYEAFFDAFDGATLYIEDVKQLAFYYSLGVEGLFGYTQAQFNQDGRLWHQLVHPDDLADVVDHHRLLFQGVSVDHTFRITHPTEGEKWIQKIAKPIADDKGRIIKIYGKFVDVTAQKTLEHQLRKMAYFDDLTDLPNRKMLDRHIKKALARSKRHGHPFSMMFLDLDDFKAINDELGHEVGDLYLVEITKRLDDCVREEDLIARFGGDEFIVVFEETEQQEIETIAERILDSLQSPVFIRSHELKVSASIGISLYPEHGETKEALIRRADQAMYAAKHDGKNHYQVYHEGLEDLEPEDEGIFQKWINALFFNSN
ncbi:hypothetical protein HMI01_09310 [Halolactibacillus miurensis]|uniref:PAS domain S-box-containing protein/diguanylate cyclase (GGDEF) domain-containing protein n=1 Tax=Halolactibacillus miurensis TaxID=306541 RepID=A0A1I6S8Z4_9BACI|nr:MULTISPECIES: sensor domain-containing diguanylate cyclase [Halolactibacillus]GEM03943.1 hypothetical protein HMI01_09310 [Halolactibacillus miurensis]SFS73407.1 PAS domain S-box-containing protein/diguanylate cyclase (GGDEF) domain-containing protein [Halolactibacillus miurensis]